MPVSVKLESWTPFIPLATDDSSLPVTIMEYTVENRSDKPVKGRLAGLWENPVLIHSRQAIRGHAHFADPQGKRTDDPAPFRRRKMPAQASGDFGTAALTLLGDSTKTETNSTDQLSAGFQLQPGEKTTLRFLLTWHFPNMQRLPKIGAQVPHYTTRFADAAAVARACGGSLRRTARRHHALGRHLERLDASAVVARPLHPHHQHAANHQLPRLRQRPLLGVGRHRLLPRHLRPRLAIRAGRTPACFPEIERNLREVTDLRHRP